MAGLVGIRSFVVFGVLAGLLGSAPALSAQTDPHWLGSRMNDWYAEASHSAPGEWGIAVADPAGQMLWSFNADASLMPASTVKLFTTGYARSVLGGSARRATRLVGTGIVDPKTGEWLGDWALELNGDPSLERAEGSGPTLYDLALQLKAAGVRRLSGSLRVPPRRRELTGDGVCYHPERTAIPVALGAEERRWLGSQR